MLDVFVGEALAPRTLRQSHPLSQGAVVGFAIGGVKGVHRESAFNAYRHFTTLLGMWLVAWECHDCSGRSARWLGATEVRYQLESLPSTHLHPWMKPVGYVFLTAVPTVSIPSIIQNAILV